MFACPATDDFFRARIDQMIDLRHPLAVLASRMPWQEIEARVAHLFVRKAQADKAMPELVEAAKQAGIGLKQTFAKEGQALNHQAGRYAHARQFKRMRRAIRRQATIVGRLAREIECKANSLAQAVRDALSEVVGKATRLVAQSAQRKAVDGHPKLYAWHAPEVSCISKGKARRPYEFGVKVGIASTLRGNLIVGARAFHRTPYDGHTLHAQMEQAAILMQDRAPKPTTAFVDSGYRGVDADNPSLHIVHRGKPTRRQAIEPIIGHLKADHRMGRCHLKGETGDALHAVLCAAGYNIKWLLRMIARKGVSFMWQTFVRLKKPATPQRFWRILVDGRLSGGSNRHLGDLQARALAI